MDFSVSRHHRHSRQGILPSKKKRLRSFFSPLQEQGFYAAKTESCCIKHTLLFAPAQINPSVKDGSRVSQKRTLYASKTSVFRLGAKLLSLVPKSLIFYEATNTQIEATSTQLAKRVEKEHRRHLYLPRRTVNRRCPPSQKSPIGMHSFSRGCTANTDGTSTTQSKGCICERRYNCPDAGRGKSAMGFLNEGMDDSTSYAGEDSRHHRHTSLSDKRSSPDVGTSGQMKKPVLE